MAADRFASRKSKPCANCGLDFPTSQARRKFCSDECQQIKARATFNEKRAANPEYYREAAKRGYERHRPERIVTARLYCKSERGREMSRLRSAIRRVTDKDKVLARAAVNNAVRDGRLTRQQCRDCDSKETHGHHPDYSKPLEVIWLCPEHHIAEHRRTDNGR